MDNMYFINYSDETEYFFCDVVSKKHIILLGLRGQRQNMCLCCAEKLSGLVLEINNKINSVYEKYKNLLWCDLNSIQEKIEFMQCGIAVETGIIAPALVDDLISIFTQLNDFKETQIKSDY